MSTAYLKQPLKSGITRDRAWMDKKHQSISVQHHRLPYSAISIVPSCFDGKTLVAHHFEQTVLFFRVAPADGCRGPVFALPKATIVTVRTERFNGHRKWYCTGVGIRIDGWRLEAPPTAGTPKPSVQVQYGEPMCQLGVVQTITPSTPVDRKPNSEVQYMMES